MTKKLGLALGSGGGRGLVHVGILRGLEKAGIEVSYISGASIGACVGALYASGLSAAQIQEKFMEDKWEVFRCIADPAVLGGFVGGRKVKKLFEKWFELRDFSQLKIPFSAVAADLVSGEEVRFFDGDLLQAIQASMAVPMMFKPMTIDDRVLVDGGIVNPVPDNVVKEMGAEVIIAVNLDYRINTDKSAKSYKWVNIVGLRSLNIIRHYLAEYGIKDADFVLNPEIDDPGVIGLKTYMKDDKAEEVIQLGEDLINEKIEDIKAALS